MVTREMLTRYYAKQADDGIYLGTGNRLVPADRPEVPSANPPRNGPSFPSAFLPRKPVGMTGHAKRNLDGPSFRSNSARVQTAVVLGSRGRGMVGREPPIAPSRPFNAVIKGNPRIPRGECKACEQRRPVGKDGLCAPCGTLINGVSISDLLTRGKANG